MTVSREPHAQAGGGGGTGYTVGACPRGQGAHFRAHITARLHPVFGSRGGIAAVKRSPALPGVVFGSHLACDHPNRFRVGTISATQSFQGLGPRRAANIGVRSTLPCAIVFGFCGGRAFDLILHRGPRLVDLAEEAAAVGHRLRGCQVGGRTNALGDRRNHCLRLWQIGGRSRPGR